MTGACIQHYLLEKSRIKSQNFGDRNYHIFYCLLTGLSADEKKSLQLTTAKDYFYLKQGDSLICDGRIEMNEFLELKDALITLKFSEEETNGMFKVLASILHIGNLNYNETIKENDDACDVENNIHLNMMSTLLSMDKAQLIEILINRTIIVLGNRVVSHITVSQALSKRDAFAMSLYTRIFTYVITKINKSVSDHNASKIVSIGILDIFGFENFVTNSFEQLCINYANEHLQHFFVQHVFKMEQEEYKNEGIGWNELEYKDNQSVLNLLGAKQIGVLMLIDEQSRFPKGNDEAYLVKLNQNCSDHDYYRQSKSEVSKSFGIKHYAGTVTYSVDGFVEKNMNTLSSDWLDVVKNSTNAFLKTLFAKDLLLNIKSNSPTLVAQYISSMESLMTTLNDCEPFFIRCIKPNHYKIPDNFSHSLVCQQLRYLGMVDTVRIRQSGYPIRHTYMQFIARYRILLPGCPSLTKISNHKLATENLCQKYLKPNEFRLGKTKVFLKIPDELLESYREDVLTKSAVIIQRNIRVYIFRKRFLRMRKAAITIQSFWRGYRPRKIYLLMRQGYLRLQACIRSRQQRRTYSFLKRVIIRLQARCRGLLLRNKIKLADMSPILLVPPIPAARSRSNSAAEIGLENWITNVFDLAVSDKSSKPYEQIVNSETINVSEILQNNDVITFEKFAATNFTGNVSYKHSTKKLQQPLLELSSPGDQLAATVVWTTMLRFMGDLDAPSKSIVKSKKPVMSQLCKTISKSFIHSKQYMDAFQAFKDEEEKVTNNILNEGRSTLMDLTLVHRSKLESEVKRGLLEIESLNDSYNEWLYKTDSELLDKLQFIIGHGILRPALRDEIYCQLCKQLSNNPSQLSTMFGWVLMSLCASCFTPSSKLAPTLLHFMAKNGNKLDCIMKLQRTILNGPRNDPPTTFELNALKTLSPIILKIHLTDGSVISINADAATTANEVCTKVAETINLTETFGFSLFICMFGKTISLESGGCHVMDGISQCESLVKERGLTENEIMWTLSFRKEMFNPWQILTTDPVATNLVYNQIITSSSLGDYRCSKDAEFALLVAQHYFVTCGKILLPEILINLITEVIPIPVIRNKGTVYWVKLITDTFNKSYFVKCNLLEEDVKQDVVEFGKRKWPLLLSKYYEVRQIAGINFGISPLLIAINSDGIYFVKNTTEILQKIHYIEIVSIEYSQIDEDGDQIHILTIYNYNYVFQTNFAEIICHLVNWILNELKARSKYVVAISNYSSPDENFLSLNKGDLVILDEAPQTSSEWFKGYKPDTISIGEFPSNMVKILPTTSIPSQYIMDAIKNEKPSNFDLTVKSLLVNRHTLQLYATKYFRVIPKSNRKITELWKFSTNLLWQPLHKDLSPHLQGVTTMFTTILYYCGDRSLGNQKPHIRPIFDPPLYQENLRDELYCQLMKQLTDNPKQESEIKLWELMWLATGLFPCSTILLKDLKLFLITRPTKLSQECLKRLEKIYYKGCRRYSHHWAELDAIQNDGPILHNIIFPNGMSHMFYVESSMNVDELVYVIGKWLGVQNIEEFCLMINIGNVHFFLDNNDFFFDAILDACNFPNSTSGTDTPRYNYEILFVRKLWINTYAGIDETADLVCHYYQELPKYMSGAHICTIEDVTHIGALLYKAEYENKHELNNEIMKYLPNIIPEFLINTFSEREWLLHITKIYEQIKNLSSDEAKINFLKIAQRWVTFGSAFFNIYKSSTYQDNQMILAINRNGVFVINPYTKELEIHHSFKEIVSCSSNGQNTFTLVVHNAAYSWSSKAPYNIENIIKSYIQAQ